ncbi:MAG: hypothetical protein U9R25_07855 [Chloroflexota bacterium]|nr:hypothetical protein [Chloroflexota bacterium]
MRGSTHLPNLSILPVNRLRLHESCDERRVDALAKRLLEEKRLKNPPVVTPLPDSNDFMVLDGANRVSTFARLKIPHIVVQVVSYDDPGIELNTWYHVVAGMPQRTFSAALDAVPNLQLETCTIEGARQTVALGDAIAYIICADAVYLVRNHDPETGSEIRLLNDLVGAYKGKANIYRASNDDFQKQAPTYPDINALVVFPAYRPADLIGLVRRGEVVPSGITRHIIPERALRINVPLSILEAEGNLEEKQAWMQQWWRDQLDRNAIRFYAESTFLFDE